MERKRFRKEERLCSKRSIDDLFHIGSSFVLYPYRVVFRWAEAGQKSGSALPVRVLFSVPKRKFRKAVDRNRIKRRIKEAYRLQKELLYLRVPQEADPKVDLRRGSERAVRLDLAIQYIAAEAKDFSFLYGKMKDVLSKLRNEYAEVYLGEGR